jgi:hypothetical protein
MAAWVWEGDSQYVHKVGHSSCGQAEGTRPPSSDNGVQEVDDNHNERQLHGYDR